MYLLCVAPDQACLQLWWPQLGQMALRHQQSCSSGRGSCRISPRRDQTVQSEEILPGSLCSPSARCQCQTHTDEQRAKRHCHVRLSDAGKVFYYYKRFQFNLPFPRSTWRPQGPSLLVASSSAPHSSLWPQSPAAQEVCQERCPLIVKR